MAASDPIADSVAAAVDVLKGIDLWAAELFTLGTRQLDQLEKFATSTQTALERVIREIDHAANAAAMGRAGPGGQPQQPQGGGAGAGDLDEAVRRAAAALTKAAKTAADLLEQAGKGKGPGDEKDDDPAPAQKAAAGLMRVAGSLTFLSGVASTAATGIVSFATSVVASLTRWTAAFDPAQTYLAQLAAQNLTATLGRLLMPALQVAAQLTSTLADTLISLGPESARLVSGLFLAGAAFAATAALAVGVAAAINFATGGLTGLIATILSLVAGSVAFGAVMDTTGAVMESLRGVIESMAPLLTTLGETAVVVVEALAPLVEAMVGGLVPVLQLVALLVQGLVYVLTPVVLLLDGLATAIGWVADQVMRFLRFIGLASAAEPPAVRRGGAAAAAVTQPAQFMSGESYAQRAYANAYAAGMGDPVVAAIDRSGATLGSIEGLVREMTEYVRAEAGMTGPAGPAPAAPALPAGGPRTAVAPAPAPAGGIP